MKKEHNFFENISFVAENLAKNLGLEKGLKTSSLCRLWPKVIGPRFEKTSKIFSIYENQGFDIVNVSVSSSAVMQELVFYKSDILKKIQKLGANFGFNIKDITFSTKTWKRDVLEEEKQEISFSEIDLEKIIIPDNVLKSIEKSLSEQDFFDEEMKERFFNTIVKDLKTQMWLKSKNLQK